MSTWTSRSTQTRRTGSPWRNGSTSPATRVRGRHRLLDAGLHVEWASASTADLLDLDPTSLIGRPVASLLATDEEREMLCSGLLGRPDSAVAPSAAVLHLCRGDGATVQTEVRWSDMRDDRPCAACSSWRATCRVCCPSPAGARASTDRPDARPQPSRRSRLRRRGIPTGGPDDAPGGDRRRPHRCTQPPRSRRDAHTPVRLPGIPEHRRALHRPRRLQVRERPLRTRRRRPGPGRGRSSTPVGRPTRRRRLPRRRRRVRRRPARRRGRAPRAAGGAPCPGGRRANGPLVGGGDPGADQPRLVVPRRGEPLGAVVDDADLEMYDDKRRRPAS